MKAMGEVCHCLEVAGKESFCPWGGTTQPPLQWRTSAMPVPNGSMPDVGPHFPTQQCILWEVGLGCIMLNPLDHFSPLDDAPAWLGSWERKHGS